MTKQKLKQLKIWGEFTRRILDYTYDEGQSKTSSRTQPDARVQASGTLRFARRRWRPPTTSVVTSYVCGMNLYQPSVKLAIKIRVGSNVSTIEPRVTSLK